MSQNIKLIEYSDYKNISGGLPNKNTFTETIESETMPNLSYAWNDTLKALHVNDSSSSAKGSLDMSLGFLNIGDVIEISVEVMNISGVKAKIAIDNIETGLQNLFILQSSKQNEFEFLGGKYIVKNSGEHRTAFGVFTADVGEYYIRNVKINIHKSQSNVFLQPVAIPSAVSPEQAVNKLQVETMFEMFKQQLRGYNFGGPDLEGKEYLGDGEFLILSHNTANPFTLIYNVYNGVYTFNGLPSNVGNYKLNDLHVPIGNYVTMSFVYISGTSSSSSRPFFSLGSLSKGVNINNPFGTFEIESNDDRFRTLLADNVSFNNYKVKLQIEKGDTATAYTVPGQIPQYKIVGEE